MSDFYNKYPYTDFHELNLDWVIERVKQLTEDWAATLEEWNSTEEQWQQLYDYVHDYFANLDVQQEINNKINTMIADGTFVTITTPVIEAKVASMMPATVASQIGDTVASQIGATVASQIGNTVASQISDAVVTPVTNWLDTNITQPTTPVVDTSLSISGAAADAEVTGLNINDIRNGSQLMPFNNIEGKTLNYVLADMAVEDGYVRVSDLDIIYSPDTFKHIKMNSHGMKSIEIDQADIITVSGEFAYIIVAEGSTVIKTFRTNDSFTFDQDSDYDIYINRFAGNPDYANSINIEYYDLYNNVHNLETALVNYAKPTEYLNNVVGGTSYTTNAFWTVLYFDQPAYVKRYKPIVSGSYTWAIGTCSTDIADGVTISIGDVHTGGDYIDINHVINKRYVLLLCGTIKYKLSTDPDTDITYDNSRLCVANLSTGVASYNTFTGNRFIGRFEIVEFDKYNTVPYIEPIKTTSLFGSFRSIGVIGDSLSVGCIHGVSDRNLYFSWPQYLARKHEAHCINMGKSGVTCAGWWSDPDCRTVFLADGNQCQSYIIGLGVNDSNLSTTIGTSADIDIADYTQNANTFYGNYAKIVQLIKATYPSSKIFLLTMPYPYGEMTGREAYNDAIREIATMFTNVYLLDLYQYNDLFKTTFMVDDFIEGHYTAIGYKHIADILDDLLGKFIDTNADEFRLIAGIPDSFT